MSSYGDEIVGAVCFYSTKIALGKETGKAFLHTKGWFPTNRRTAWIFETTETGPDVRACELLI
jgi:hypothetical protein